MIMNKTKVLTALLMLVLLPAVVCADIRQHLDRFEFGPSAGVGFYVGKSNPSSALPDVYRIHWYDPVKFDTKGLRDYGWPGGETFGFSVGYRIDTRWGVALKTYRQRVCFAEYDKLPENGAEKTRCLYYNAMWHVDAMAEFNLLNYGNVMMPEQDIYSVVPYLGFGLGVTMFNKTATLRSNMYGYDGKMFPSVGLEGQELAVGLYLPVAFGFKYRINDNVQLKGAFQYQLYFSGNKPGGLNSNLEGGTYYEGVMNAENRPTFDQLDKHIVGYSHDCVFSLSAIFNLEKWKEDRLIMY